MFFSHSNSEGSAREPPASPEHMRFRREGRKVKGSGAQGGPPPCQAQWPLTSAAEAEEKLLQLKEWRLM